VVKLSPRHDEQRKWLNEENNHIAGTQHSFVRHMLLEAAAVATKVVSMQLLA
jgi:hypothetical protein